MGNFLCILATLSTQHMINAESGSTLAENFVLQLFFQSFFLILHCHKCNPFSFSNQLTKYICRMETSI